MGSELTLAARAECTQALKGKMARTNQKPPVSKRPIAAGNREKGWERQREQSGNRTWGEESKKEGENAKRNGCHGQRRAVKVKERTVRATDRGLGKGKGSRGRKCINKTSQTWSSVTLSKMCKGKKITMMSVIKQLRLLQTICTSKVQAALLNSIENKRGKGKGRGTSQITFRSVNVRWQMDFFFLI